ncbi:hypothetical protein PFICI_13484 [Pestalotiopsis fici W106-1]|uniref:Tat pathway signal sequence n=1 Tax=Pestalotiopsis fici (strain W106-1 / CGMCC3.15140) TaxID=1229662 RepID=W3WM46_PESFW|nr:uncharacterized protein PFICI_13484 [Pestalotiopsis fici W106-1]ETS75000.1 hypothetical protein PFICI_13484 [Pestalotiopsis fici W106-1]
MASQHRYSPVASTERNSNDLQELDFDDKDTSRHSQRRQTLYHCLVVLLIVSNIGFASLWLLYPRVKSWQDSSDCARPQLIYSPATSALRYEKKRLWRDIDGPNPYTGKPRPEHDEAWRELISPITIKVSADELSRFSGGDSTIEFADGSGYIAEMGVYHELHCIKRVRRYLHLSHYYPNMTEADRVREDAHIDHCLEYWRESAMCRGDVTLGTFFWRDGYPTSRVYTDNECIDWHALDTWARRRMVDMNDRSIFVGYE